MAVLAYKQINTQGGSSKVFCYTLEYDVSGRTITFYSRMRCSWSSAPYYQWTHTNSLTVAGSTVSGSSAWSASDWKSSSITINGKAYALCYTSASKSYTAGSGAVTVSASDSYKVSGSANYLPVAGTYSNSGSYTFPALTVWNDVNVLNPSGVQDSQSGYFDLYTSENDSWRYNLVNEDSDMTHTIGTYFQVQNIRPYYDYYELDYVSGHDSTPAAGAYRKTFDTANEIMTIQMKYRSYTLTVNPNGGYYNGSASNTNITQAFNTSYQLNYPVRTGYLFSHWVASRGSNFDQVGAAVNTYNNNGNGATVTTWLQIESSSGTNMDVLKIVTNGSASPGAGGFYQAFQTAANHTYIQTYRLKVPVGYTVSYASNAIGDGTVVDSLTDMAGTGNWQTYIFRLRTGGSGTFSTSGFIYLNGSNNTSVEWYMADAQVWDITDQVYRAHANGSYAFNYAASNCTLTAQWQPNRYFINYNANGGSGSMSNSEHYYDSSSPLSANTFTRDGYAFMGWSTSSTATSATYSDQASILNLTADLNQTITLYAVWEARKSYVDLNGWLDGVSSNGIAPHGVADVVINGNVVETGVTDYWIEHFVGTQYAFTNIKPNPGYQFNGLYSGSYGGVVGLEAVATVLDFTTRKPYFVQIEGAINDANSISLSWSAQGIGTISYQVFANNNKIYEGTNTSYVFEAQDDTTYNFYVIAINTQGSTTSSTIALTTPSNQKTAWIKKATGGAVVMPDNLTLLEYLASPEGNRIQTRDTFNTGTTTIEMSWNDVTTEQNMGSYCYYFGVKDGYYTIQGEKTSYQAVAGRKDIITLESVDVTDYPDPSLGITGISVSVNITMKINGTIVSTVSTSYSGSSAPSYSVFMLFSTSADSYATPCNAQIYQYNEYYPVMDENGQIYMADSTGYPLEGSQNGQIFYPAPERVQDMSAEWQLGKVWFKQEDGTWIRVKTLTII